ncbi:MAG: hypothetical protein JRG73_11620 [Deltaproteobacteria bacterium]|nr:hypothetical protein [Deltaproteobacteria bacterium]
MNLETYREKALIRMVVIGLPRKMWRTLENAFEVVGKERNIRDLDEFISVSLMESLIHTHVTEQSVWAISGSISEAYEFRLCMVGLTGDIWASCDSVAEYTDCPLEMLLSINLIMSIAKKKEEMEKKNARPGVVEILIPRTLAKRLLSILKRGDLEGQPDPVREVAEWVRRAVEEFD